MRDREDDTDYLLDHRTQDLERPGRPIEPMFVRPATEYRADACKSVLVDLAHAVLDPVVQETRFSFALEPRYSAHSGRGDAADFTRRGIAAEP